MGAPNSLAVIPDARRTREPEPRSHKHQSGNGPSGPGSRRRPGFSLCAQRKPLRQRPPLVIPEARSAIRDPFLHPDTDPIGPGSPLRCGRDDNRSARQELHLILLDEIRTYPAASFSARPAISMTWSKNRVDWRVANRPGFQRTYTGAHETQRLAPLATA